MIQQRYTNTQLFYSNDTQLCKNKMGDVLPCTTVCVWHMYGDMLWNIHCMFSLHCLEIRVVFKESKEVNQE